MIWGLASLFAVAILLSQCEPHRPSSGVVREPGFILGVFAALAVAAGMSWGMSGTGWDLGRVLLGNALVFVAGYLVGRAVRRIARPRAVAIAMVLGVAGSLGQAVAPQSSAASSLPFASLAAILGPVVYGAIAVGGLRRLRASDEPMFNSVEQRIVAAAVSHWYALDRDSASRAASAVAAYLAAGDLLTRAGLKLALWAFQWSPLFIIGRPMPFASLGSEDQERHLVRIERSGLVPLRFALLSLRLVSGMLHFESQGTTLSANPACPQPASA